MLKAMEVIVYVVRFILEMVTIFGLIGGGLIVGNRSQKLIFPVLGILVIIFWWLFVAPKAAYPKGALVKFIVEVLVFTVGTIGMTQLFGNDWGRIYAVVAIVDLFSVYLLLFLKV